MASNGTSQLDGCGNAVIQTESFGTVSTTNTVFVAPVVADLNVEANAAITILNKLSVSMEYNDRYDIKLDLSDSCILLNCFDISGAGENFEVGTLHQSQFHSVMTKILDNATCTDTSGMIIDGTAQTGGPDIDSDAVIAAGAGTGAGEVGHTVHQTLNNQLLRLFKNIYTDGIANILQSGYSFSTVVDTSAGANNMWVKLNENSRSAAEVIAQQIPLGNWNLYMNAAGDLATGTSGENPLTSALPMKAGDQLVFLFRTDEEIAVYRGQPTNGSTSNVLGDTTTTTTSGGTSYNGATNTIAGDTAAAGFLTPYGNTLALSYKYNQRTIAFFVQVGGAALAPGAAFECAGAAAGNFPDGKLRAAHLSSIYTGEAGQLATAPVYGVTDHAGGALGETVVDSVAGTGAEPAPVIVPT